tara:strand:- start:112 stop:1050 length:939 start_codon:yes stop_codon:yes gene_type:complete
MTKIFYVTENTPDYSQVNFFKTEKKALEYGISQLPQFDMYDEPMNDEESDGEEWYVGKSIKFKKGILFSVEEGDIYIQDMDEDAARSYCNDEDIGAIFFDGFQKGMYGYLGNGADGKGIKWDWDGTDINESKGGMKYILTLEKYIGYKDYEKSKWGTPEEIEDDVQQFVTNLLKPVSDQLKKVEYTDSSNDKGIKWEVLVNGKDVLYLYKTNTYMGQYEIYLNKKKSTEYDVQQYFINKYLSDLDKYTSSMDGYDVNYQRSDDNRAYKAGAAHSKKLSDMYSKLSSSDKKKAHAAFVKRHRTDSTFKDFLGV